MQIRRHPEFDKWLKRLRDERAIGIIARRIDRLHTGNFGDFKPVGEGVKELRIDTGPGYRVYFVQRGAVTIILLIGGDKSTQQADIAKAQKLAKTLGDWIDDSQN
jgi:putative addiction module killer protein